VIQLSGECAVVNVGVNDGHCAVPSGEVSDECAVFVSEREPNGKWSALRRGKG
jgi:hypothetical protein